MAPGQRLSRECERDSAGADRSKFHAAPNGFKPAISTIHAIARSIFSM